jgi:hypothetical protein
MEEVYSFLESVKPKNLKEKSKTLVRAKQGLDTIPEGFEKNKRQPAQGLNDNILNDFEHKDKARKGLLFLLNKLSSGSFCPEINQYFRELRENNVREGPASFKKENSKKEGVGLIKNLRRQNFLEKMEVKKESPDIQSNEDEIFKVNFRNVANKEKPAFTVMNALNTKHMTFRKRKKKNEFLMEKKAEENRYVKNYKDDFSERELILFYSDKEIENSKKRKTIYFPPKIKHKLPTKKTDAPKKSSNSVIFINHDNKPNISDLSPLQRARGGHSTLHEGKGSLSKLPPNHNKHSIIRSNVIKLEQPSEEIKEEKHSSESD